MASGITRGRVRTSATTTESRNLTAILQILGLHVTSETFPYLGIRHAGVPPRVKFTCVYMHLCHRCVLIMDSSENERVPSIEELWSKIPILLEYCVKLDDSVKRRYLEKIADVGVDPVTIPDQQFDTECLPLIKAMDLLSYLVLETSFCTKEQFKGYKSLEAYNFVVSGFLTRIQGCIIAGKHVVTGKVRHSQRMNDPLISVWIVAEKDGTVRSAHCLGCKAGLSESCSHVASVLLYIEPWTRIRNAHGFYDHHL